MPCQSIAGEVPDNLSEWGGSFAPPRRFKHAGSVQGHEQSVHTEDGNKGHQTGSCNVRGTEEAERLVVYRTNMICDS